MNITDASFSLNATSPELGLDSKATQDLLHQLKDLNGTVLVSEISWDPAKLAINFVFKDKRAFVVTLDSQPVDAKVARYGVSSSGFFNGGEYDLMRAIAGTIGGMVASFGLTALDILYT